MIINNNLWTDVGAQKHNVLKQTQENWSITLSIGFIETETVQDKMCLEVWLGYMNTLLICMMLYSKMICFCKTIFWLANYQTGSVILVVSNGESFKRFL